MHDVTLLKKISCKPWCCLANNIGIYVKIGIAIRMSKDYIALIGTVNTEIQFAPEPESNHARVKLVLIKLLD